ncbi:MAG TPA: Fe-S protein assembly co-chaperone HscB [Candidatus Methylomirabilis sp.]|nr:Fe-S protein assembly co-chaperone HscB [Candidatus Methylomirabilis sp.]
MSGGDYFEIFGLPRTLELDGDELRRRFYALSRRHHPDFHQAGGVEEQAAALERSAAINRAYRTLRDPMARVEYVIALAEGRETREGTEVKPAVPRDLLEEMLELQEALEEARSSGLDGPARERLARERQGLVERQASGESAIVGRFADWDRAVETGSGGPALIEWFKRALATRAYLRTVIDDLAEALGEQQEAHVSHRRH